MNNRCILITGGAGFIGSPLVRRMVNTYSDYTIINLDKLTYAGNLANLKDIEHAANYHFVKGDICDWGFLEKLFEQYPIDGVIHLAAESHVDRSILDPRPFIETNIVGTVSLLSMASRYWKGREDVRFHHVSTDEVFGSLENEGFFTEETSYDPQSPYAASKAGSDHFVRAFGNTYKLPYVISNCSNNYGPYQFPEKLIPLFISNILQQKTLPVYGKGDNIRDWLWVEDHCSAIDMIFHQGENGKSYNIGGKNEWKNIDLIHLLCDIMDEKLGREKGASRQLIQYVTDRPGHDMRYAIDSAKIERELEWKPSLQFEEGLEKTIDWYLENEDWINHVKSGAYMTYYDQQYGERIA